VMGSVASAHSSASAAARRDLRRTYHNVPPATAPTATTTFHFTRSTLAAVLIASLAKLAPRGSRFVAAYFVVARGRKACPLHPPQHGGARSVLIGSLRSLRMLRLGRYGVGL
jgi:hypothetical protein